MDENKLRLKTIREELNTPGLVLLAYYGIMNVAVIMLCLLDLIVYLFANLDSFSPFLMMERVMDFVTGNGWGYLIAIAVGGVIVLKWKGFRFWKEEVFSKENTMTAATFLQLLCVFVSVQALLQVFAPALEWLLNLLGLSAMAALETATISATGFTMFLYVSFLGPIAEELLFRGLLLRMLRPYGKQFAILVSAILFGLFHGNVIQIPFAFLIGLVLGYVTVEYSIVWAIVLHIFNNFVLSDLMGRLSGLLRVGVGDYLLLGIFAAAAVVTVVLMILRWAQVKAHFRENPADKTAVKAFLTTPCVWIFAVLMLLNCLLTITRV